MIPFLSGNWYLKKDDNIVLKCHLKIQCKFTCFLLASSLMLSIQTSIAHLILKLSISQVSGNYFNGQLVYNGSFTITASGANAPCQFQITNNPGGVFGNSSSNNGYFGSLPPFVYKVSVFDVSGQKVADTIVPVTTLNPLPSLYCLLQIPTSCYSTTGQIVCIGNGGTPPYSYVSPLPTPYCNI